MGGATTSSGGGGPSSMAPESRHTPEGPNRSCWASQADEDWCGREGGGLRCLYVRAANDPPKKPVLEPEVAHAKRWSIDVGGARIPDWGCGWALQTRLEAWRPCPRRAAQVHVKAMVCGQNSTACLLTLACLTKPADKWPAAGSGLSAMISLSSTMPRGKREIRPRGGLPSRGRPSQRYMQRSAAQRIQEL